MAKNKSTVFLGYEDEEVSLKHVDLLNSTVNKIGGYPDWPSGEIIVPPCILCGRTRCLVVQIYAPLEQSQFHRTLYIFSCVNALCSQNSKSWSCIRTQHMVGSSPVEVVNDKSPKLSSCKSNKKKKVKQSASVPQKINWCSGADDWGDDSGADFCEEMDTEADDVQPDNEENGNVIGNNDNSPVRGAAVGGSLDHSEDDDEDESTSMENDIVYGLAQMEIHSPQNPSGHDPNANCAAAIADEKSGESNTAVGYAEIEASENDVVFVETPKVPERDLISLINSSGSQNAVGSLNKISDLTLKSYFIAVDVEQKYEDFENYGNGGLSTEHIRELYQEYKRQDEAAMTPNTVVVSGASGGGGGGLDDNETYEKSLPAHGDVMFHQFLSVIHQNPGQILRYSRDTLPLLIAPLNEHVPKCPNCNGETICEVQILSTIIPKLFFQQNNENCPIEFGNVLVFTCLKSCWDTPDKMRYERVIVQAEN